MQDACIVLDDADIKLAASNIVKRRLQLQRPAVYGREGGAGHREHRRRAGEAGGRRRGQAVRWQARGMRCSPLRGACSRSAIFVVWAALHGQVMCSMPMTLQSQERAVCLSCAAASAADHGTRGQPGSKSGPWAAWQVRCTLPRWLRACMSSPKVRSRSTEVCGYGASSASGPRRGWAEDMHLAMDKCMMVRDQGSEFAEAS